MKRWTRDNGVGKSQYTSVFGHVWAVTRRTPSICVFLVLVLWAGVAVLMPGGTATAHAPDEQSAQRVVKVTEADTSPAGPVVFLDPGHGGADGGAIHRDAAGTVDLKEKDVNLAVALKAAGLLRAGGYRVILSRQGDDRPGNGLDANGDGEVTRRDTLQYVVDQANDVGADLFLSLHGNWSASPTAGGVEVYYCADRTFAADGRRLAELVQAQLLQALAKAGYQAADRGVKDDSSLYRHRPWRGHLFVLGPPATWGDWRVRPRATQMPSVVAEALFLSNDVEARLLASDEGQWALAYGYAAAVTAYFEAQSGGRPSRTEESRSTPENSNPHPHPRLPRFAW